MAGYIYILINESFIEYIKIGHTKYEPRERAKQISKPTGVPTPYHVAFEIFVSDRCKEIENQIHSRLDGFRVKENREFFRYPLNDAIKLIKDICSEAGVIAEKQSI